MCALVTAPVGDTILDGITRDSVIELARDWGMKVEIRPIAVTEVIEGIESGAVQEAFGIGTAATIANIEMIGFRDQQYNLDLSKAKFSAKVLEELNQIRYGKVEDKFGWNFVV